MKPKTLKFICKVITPMFVYGAYKNYQEIRPNAIKGHLRYWWRAVNSHLAINDMFRIENQIFGGQKAKSRNVIQDSKSKVFIDFKMTKFDDDDESELLPHKNNKKQRGMLPCFNPGSEFEISLMLLEETQFMNIEKLKSLFLVWSILGGLGRRSRRGMGAFQVIKINDNEFDIEIEDLAYEIFTHLNNVPAIIQTGQNAKHYTVSEYANGREIISKTRNLSQPITRRYPFIQSIEIGSEQGNLLLHIGDVTHDFCGKNGYKYTIGAGRPRLASPVYISTWDGYSPIITQLNTPLGREGINVQLRQDFLNEFIDYYNE